jgi:hypothetical protein
MKNMEIGWEKISENRTSVESTTAKTNSINFYGLESRKHCQVLGPGTKHVKNAHIWPHNNMENLPLIDLVATDIDNPKNVLRLHSDIEHKFDKFLLTFVPSGDGFVLEVLDPSIKSITLKDTTVILKTSTDVRSYFQAVIVHGVASLALTQFWRIAKLERRDI